MIDLAAQGRTDKEISLEMGLSMSTLRTYWDRMRQKHDARSRSELIAKTFLRAQISPEEILRNLPLFIWTLDRSGRFEFVSDWFLSYGKLKRDVAYELGCRALMPEHELSDSAERWRMAQASGKGYEAIVHFRCGPSGELRKHKLRLMSVKDSEGEVVRWIGYARELAENADEKMAVFLKDLLSKAQA